MGKARVQEGGGVTKCPKGFASITIAVTDKADGQAIKGARVEMRKEKDKKATKTGGSCTLSTDADGKVVFKVRHGTYRVEATADGSRRRQSPAATYVSAGQGPITVASKPQEIAVQLEATPVTVTPHVQCEADLIYFRPDPPEQTEPPPLEQGVVVREGEAPPPPLQPIQVSFTAAPDKGAYTGGGKLTVPEGLEPFTDAEGEQPLALEGRVATLTHEQLAGRRPLTLYLRGTQAGKVTLKLELDPAEHSSVTVEAPAERALEVVEQVRLTPSVEVEYLAIQLDRGLAAHQDGGETKVVTGPTALRLKLTQSQEEPKATTGLLITTKPTGAVEAYADAECTTKLDLANPFANADVTKSEPHTIWLVGKRKGRCELLVTAEQPKQGRDDDPRFHAEKVKVDVAVVELELKLHQHAVSDLTRVRVDPDTDPVSTYHTNLKNEQLPGQKLMRDEEKVGKGAKGLGRVLHVQKDGRFGRARLLLDKLDGAAWPEKGCDDYELVLDVDENAPSGAVKVFDAETDGTEQALPLKLKLADLLAAEKELWVEGAATTKKAHDLRIDLGLDRKASAVKHERTRNGDWARFTVIEISKVELDYTAPTGKASGWDATEKRYYINLKRPKGREVTIKATLSEKIEGVRLHFMLAPDKDNTTATNWGQALPNAWKWKDVPAHLKHIDKEDRSFLLHLAEKTDADGAAKQTLTLSQFGGDKFYPMAYSLQDPHLAKYVHGHTELGAKEPPKATDPITVWRKFWYQITKAAGNGASQPAAAETAYRDVKATMVLDQIKTFTKTQAPERTFYKKYMFVVGGGNDEVTCIGSHNKDDFKPMRATKADQPVKAHLIVCDYQYDELNLVTPVKGKTLRGMPAGRKLVYDMGEHMIDPVLDGDPVGHELRWSRYDDVAGTWGPWVHLDAGACVKIDPARTSLTHVQVTLPDTVPTPTPARKVKVAVVCCRIKGPFLGESFDGHNLIVYNPLDVADYNDTVTHEIGHALNQTPRDGAQPGAPKVPKHPTMFDAGQGNHCRVTNNAGKFKCVMYDSGPNAHGIRKFCETCHPYLLAQDFSRMK